MGSIFIGLQLIQLTVFKDTTCAYIPILQVNVLLMPILWILIPLFATQQYLQGSCLCNTATKQYRTSCNKCLFLHRSVQLLLSQGACPNLVGSKGVAAIHLAVGKETEKNTRCLKILLQHGADPNIRLMPH